MYGISDAPLGGRIYRFALSDPGGSLQVKTLSVVSLSMAPGNTRPDHEGIALLPDGNFAVSGESGSGGPILPPSISIYSRYGDFVYRTSGARQVRPRADREPPRAARAATPVSRA